MIGVLGARCGDFELSGAWVWIWFEDDERLSLEKEELVYDYIVSNLNEDYQDLLDLDQTEQASSFIDFSSGIPRG